VDNLNKGLIDVYLEKLNNSEGSYGKILAQFYWELFNIRPNRNDIVRFNQLVKLYGAKRVIFVLQSLYGQDNLNTDNLYGLIRYKCSRDLFAKANTVVSESLMSDIQKVKEQLYGGADG